MQNVVVDEKHILVDPEAFTTMIQKVEFDAKDIISSMVENEADREDAYQESLTRAWENRNVYDPQKASFFTWFKKIVVRACWDVNKGNWEQEKIKRKLMNSMDSGNYWIRGGRKIVLP